jgi:hypothetical protein
MRNRIASRKISGLTLLIAVFPLLSLAQTSPEQFLGHRVGADRKLADYGQIKAYFEKLDQESPRLQLFTIGESTLKRPMIMAVITAGVTRAGGSALAMTPPGFTMSLGCSARWPRLRSPLPFTSNPTRSRSPIMRKRWSSRTPGRVDGGGSGTSSTMS